MSESKIARRTSTELLAGQNLVLETIASGAPLEEVLPPIAALVDRQEPDGICAIFLVDDLDDGVLHLKTAPKLPLPFAAAVHRVPIGPKSRHRGLFHAYRDVALANGLKSVWSTPIRAREGAILGTLAIYYKRPRPSRKPETVA